MTTYWPVHQLFVPVFLRCSHAHSFARWSTGCTSCARSCQACTHTSELRSRNRYIFFACPLQCRMGSLLHSPGAVSSFPIASSDRRSQVHASCKFCVAKHHAIARPKKNSKAHLPGHTRVATGTCVTNYAHQSIVTESQRLWPDTGVQESTSWCSTCAGLRDLRSGENNP